MRTVAGVACTPLPTGCPAPPGCFPNCHLFLAHLPQSDWLNFNRFTLRAEKTIPIGPLRCTTAASKKANVGCGLFAPGLRFSYIPPLVHPAGLPCAQAASQPCYLLLLLPCAGPGCAARAA